MKINVNKKILEKNEDYAAANRSLFNRQKVFCANMVSSPGSGKTTILTQTVKALAGKIEIGVIEGDLQTELDAERIRNSGAKAVQIETKGACHLNAEQITDASEKLGIDKLDILIIENVGNLVCPSDFDLGEDKRIVVLSVPEGDDKCAKYPKSFAKADVMLINKIDMIKYFDFDVERVKNDVFKINPKLKIFELSAKTGEGFDNWLNWLIESKK